MKKSLIILAISTAIGVTACAGIGKAIEQALAITEQKIAQVQTTAPLEKKYSQMGQYAVAVQKFDAQDKELKTYTVYYPAGGGNYPLVVMVNGTGMATSKYEAVLKLLASWGFVVIGSEEENSWSGQGAGKSLNFALTQNRTQGSVLFDKINAEKIGVAGHSQGGVGAINLAAQTPAVKSVYTASTTKHGLAELLKWPYDVSKVRVPYFMNAGAHESDAGDGKDPSKGIAPIMSLNENFAKTSGAAVVAQRVAADHGSMLWQPSGYMTAWFLYTLNGDNQARQVFAGKNAEILNNDNWQNVRSKGLK
ncbi:poly(ethylene terephthalate) hydrolase family protein [Bergeriella denitrificans]|uniref:Predicted dienelactone hydrolase n=1 Tax=Bergeriella denitrificans TaxID=494 RepID=A0A378UFY6_BERDE|nr:hypothetical protein [Bergeriella denitrificans]STZ75411.1 Predicted dienelactone hydrolase [Bergeriella denitrificans]